MGTVKLSMWNWHCKIECVTLFSSSSVILDRGKKKRVSKVSVSRSVWCIQVAVVRQDHRTGIAIKTNFTILSFHLIRKGEYPPIFLSVSVTALCNKLIICINNLLLLLFLEDNHDDEDVAYDRECGYWLIKMFRGRTVGRAIKRDILKFGSVHLLCGLSLLIIAGVGREFVLTYVCIYYRRDTVYACVCMCVLCALCFLLQWPQWHLAATDKRLYYWL
jgi:hypothetical protein